MPDGRFPLGAAVTTAGMGKPEMDQIATLIVRTLALAADADASEIAAIRDDVGVLCSKFPPYGESLGPSGAR